ncbi:ferrous iron transport protein B [Mogibacterium kristiansenii]|uniref:Ferrous iron transport protein B n=1 Tax=Mogibacterium kristiansenii TaxID=2606708 RepID=A0A6N7X637_9FIRM|nr:ferrous iron transport protein B [Mogibacterium kristiansenii]MDD6699990.1 ferrous iron transport protein B [Mogibacterium kristiansenii]MST70982.1 ferrous iron transport protein B [Mogibacterium kristiansenii]
MTICDLEIGQSAVISAVGGEGALRQHFLDMGLIPGIEVTLIKYAPMGDPMELMVSGYSLTLRLADAAQIDITNVHEHPGGRGEVLEPIQPSKDIPHPGIGEEGRGRERDRDVSEDHIVFALAGNQNCGKTTLFNQLTGSNQHVGNFPGVTVDRKSGMIKGYPGTEVVDLPGIYSLSPYTSEEIVSRQFILEEKPSAIINIIDATNIERNLYLTMQLLELNVPIVIALNMMDEMTGNGGSVLINEMEEILQVPVIPTSAAKNQGVEELAEHAVRIARLGETHGRVDFCNPKDHNGAVHRAIHGIMSLVGDHAEAAGIPVRFAVTKLIEGDPLVTKALALTENEEEMVEKITCQMEEECGMDRSAAMADMRYTFIRRLCHQTVIKPKESKERIRSQKLDRFLTGKWTAIPAFVAIMGLVFWLTFNVIGAFFQNLLDEGIQIITHWTDQWLTAMDVATPIHSLIIDGVFTGVGSVLSFVPIVVVLYLFLSLLEDSGYMARVAFFMDKLLRRVGLSGRSIVPMLVGFGCSVPAIMSSRTLPSERDRKMTLLLIPFMSCSAKMPIYAFFANTFFPKYAAPVMISMYFIGILMAILIALIGKNTVFKGEAVPFVMELPNYRMPGAKSVLQLMWDKAKDFLQRAFSVIFIGTIVVWFLQNFNFSMNMVSDPQSSMLAALAGFLAPLFIPLGFGNWQMVTALISGFLAKESVVSMMAVVYGGTAAVRSAITPLAAFTFMVFCLLYTPCIAAVATIRKEQGRGAAILMVIFQCIVAWLVAWAVHLIGSILL